MTNEELAAENARLRQLQTQLVAALQEVWKCWTYEQIRNARLGSVVWVVAEALDDAGVSPPQPGTVGYRHG
ncbi:hypothetical protein ACU4GI_21650 [Cupriavidus basilensis]